MDVVADRTLLAIDLGGTQIRAALITPDQVVHARRAVPTADEEGVAAVVARICELAAAVRDEARHDGLPEPTAIGISAPGPLDPWNGVVVSPPNLSGWHDVPLARQVADALDLPTFLDRDTNVAVRAEWLFGAARGAGTAIYITVSTGIGGGFIVDGRPVLGPDGIAGEVGHIVVDLDGPRCGCGRIGHIEAIASGTALAREADLLLQREPGGRLAALAASAEEIDAELLARAADDGDPAAAAILAHAWIALGAVCATLVNILNPDIIVIGGSIAEHRPALFDAVRREIDRLAFAVPASRVRVAPAELKDDVSLIGLPPIVAERWADPAFGARTNMQGAQSL